MAKLSIEGALGIAVGIVLFVLDKMAIGGTVVYLFLFVIAFLLCADSVVRSGWAGSRSRKIWGGIAISVFYLIFGFWIFLRPHKLPGTETHAPASTRNDSEPVEASKQNTVPEAPHTEPRATHSKKAVRPAQPQSLPQPDTGFHEKSDVYFFTLGENGMSASATVEGLRMGQKPFAGFPITVFAKDTDNKIHYRISIWSGMSPVEVTDDELSLHEPFWDRNFDKTALEIVDEKQSPVLQVMWKTPTNLVINGIFRLQNGPVVIADSNGWRPMKPGDKIKPLFKYPSRRFQGKYADQ